MHQVHFAGRKPTRDPRKVTIPDSQRRLRVREAMAGEAPGWIFRPRRDVMRKEVGLH